MYTETQAWIDEIRASLPTEALPLAASLLLLAKSMDSEADEKGRVSGALAGSYRLTHQSLVAALKGTQGSPDADDDLFSPIAQ